MTLTRNHLYWLLQISGWALYCLITYLSKPLFNIDLPYFEVLILISIINGILVTHLFRSIIKRSEWIKLPLKKIAWYLPLATLGMLFAYAAIQTIFGVLFTFIVLLLDHDAVKQMIEQSGLAKLSEDYWGIVFLSYLNVYAMLLIWTLFYFVYHYFENLQREKIKHLAYENKLKEAELNTLKSQVNPHFLFNSLNSIRALTYSDPDMAANAISKLSDLLRASLNASATKSITLKEELQMVHDYLDIEKIRFEDRLQLSFNIAEETNSKLIPPLVVQTLVENAVKHGISKLKSGGNIDITAYIKSKQLVIDVLNTGIYSPAEDHNGYGVSNIKRRLRLLYGDAADFTIENISDSEVKATLFIPV